MDANNIKRGDLQNARWGWLRRATPPRTLAIYETTPAQPHPGPNVKKADLEPMAAPEGNSR
jgi:hypothetical protein